MKTYLSPCMLLLGLLTPWSTHAQDAPPGDGYAIKQEQADFNTHIRRAAVEGSPIPFTKTWTELSPAEQGAIRAQYADMPADEEPPFPLAGLQAVYQPMSDVIDRHSDWYHSVQGQWHLAVTVSPTGDVTSLIIIEAPDPEVARVVGNKLLGVRFKPGRCKGQPCQMDFPIDLKVSFR